MEKESHRRLYEGRPGLRLARFLSRVAEGGFAFARGAMISSDPDFARIPFSVTHNRPPGPGNWHFFREHERLCHQSASRSLPASFCRRRGLHEQRADRWNRRLAPAATRSNVGGLLGAFAYDLSIGYALIKANAIQESERPVSIPRKGREVLISFHPPLTVTYYA